MRACGRPVACASSRTRSGGPACRSSYVVRSVLDDQAWPFLRRLTRWLDRKDCFWHLAQRVSLRQDVDGLLSDNPRKSMWAMLARVTEPGFHQALQY